jgi:hypothetical protein
MRQVVLDGHALHIFPCRSDKRPTSPHGFKDAVADAADIARLWSLCPGPLIGAPTGAINGIDVIDIDLRRGGDRWLHENRDKLPTTRRHQTPSGGFHLIFKYLPGLRTSADKIASGVEVRANGPHIVWWPAHGGTVLCDAPPADFPIWVAKLGGWNGGMGVTLKSETEPNGSNVTPIPPTDYQINYANRALANACYELRRCEAGRRNHLLNVLAYKMGRLIVQGWISRERVESYLLKCCEANGLLADDGEKQCGATLASGIDAGMRRPYLRQLEDFQAFQLRTVAARNGVT